MVYLNGAPNQSLGCYTRDHNKRWEWCDIPMCARERATIVVSMFNIQKYRKVFDPLILSVR